ncbi:unnamed protein product [Arabidopsis halleri]
MKNHYQCDHHPNILRCFGTSYDYQFVYICFQPWICMLRDLIDYGIPQKRGAFTDHQLRFLKEFYKSYPLWKNKAPSSLPLSLIKDIFSGVAQFHSDEFIHMGLTPDAVFIISSKKTVFATILLVRLCSQVRKQRKIILQMFLHWVVWSSLLY